MAQKAKKANKKKLTVRNAVQIGFLILVAAIAVNHTIAEAQGAGLPLLSDASLHAICPFGGVVSIYQYATTGAFVASAPPPTSPPTSPPFSTTPP